jgi:hypothetical protein
MPGAGLTVMSAGQARPDRLALKPYWGKPAVRNFREGDGNVGIIRSPVRAIALPDLRTTEGLEGCGTASGAIASGLRLLVSS